MTRPLPVTSRPRVYCASPTSRIKMWRDRAFANANELNIVSTWHENLDFDADDTDPIACARYWYSDFKEIRRADVLLVYAEYTDRPNGTLVEIGYALAHDTPVHLVGNYTWGTWKHDPLVTHHATLREAVAAINGVTPNDPSNT